MKKPKKRPLMKRRRCLKCKEWFTPRRRARKIQQRHCSKTDCQEQRKAENKKDWWRRNPDYDQSRKAKIQDWAKAYPDYWRRYRASHPEYVRKDNRRRVLSRQKSRVSAKQDLTRQMSVEKLRSLKDFGPAESAKQDLTSRRVDGLVDYLLWREESAKQNPIVSALSP